MSSYRRLKAYPLPPALSRKGRGAFRMETNSEGVPNTFYFKKLTVSRQGSNPGYLDRLAINGSKEIQSWVSDHETDRYLAFCGNG
jgi:hypothetical protein